MTEITWPDGWSPEQCVNQIEEAIHVPKLTAAQVWPHLLDTAQWEGFYGYMSGVYVHSGDPILTHDSRFRLNTLTFIIEAQVTHFEPPSENKAGQLGWYGHVDEAGGTLDLHHRWLIKNDAKGVWIVTAEVQKGELARKIVSNRPNPIHYAHQDWLRGLAVTAIRTQNQ